MKQTLTIIVWGILLLQTQLYAQNLPLPSNQQKPEKPLLFSTLPEQFKCNYDSLQKLLNTEIKAHISVQLSSQLLVVGQVVDKSQQNAAQFSMNIRLRNFSNALFNISVRLMADNSTIIQGRILHPKYGDVLLLAKDKNNYLFKKQSQRLYMPE